MSYTKGASQAVGPYVSGGTQTYQQANNAENEYTEAVLSHGPYDLATFVLSGGVATKDGTIASQLDVTQCIALLKQPTDASGGATFRWQVLNATNFSTTGNPSTTMFLDFNPDGTTSWATTHSAQANYLPLASVTTDASANISVVTDARTTLVNLFPTAVGTDLQFAGQHVLLANLGGATVWEAQTLPTSGPKKYDIGVQRNFA